MLQNRFRQLHPFLLVISKPCCSILGFVGSHESEKFESSLELETEDTEISIHAFIFQLLNWSLILQMLRCLFQLTAARNVFNSLDCEFKETDIKSHQISFPGRSVTVDRALKNCPI